TSIVRRQWRQCGTLAKTGSRNKSIKPVSYVKSSATLFAPSSSTQLRSRPLSPTSPRPSTPTAPSTACPSCLRRKGVRNLSGKRFPDTFSPTRLTGRDFLRRFHLLRRPKLGDALLQGVHQVSIWLPQFGQPLVYMSG